MGKKVLSFDALLLLVLVLVRVRVDTLAIAVIPRPTELVAQVPLLGDILSPAAKRLLVDWMSDPVTSLLIMVTFALTMVYLLLDVWNRAVSGGGSRTAPTVLFPLPLRRAREEDEDGTPSGVSSPLPSERERVKDKAGKSPPVSSTLPSERERAVQLPLPSEGEQAVSSPLPSQRERVRVRVPGPGRSLYRAKLTILYLIIFLITGVSTLLVVGLRYVTEPARYAHDGGVLETESAMYFLLDGKNPYVETYRGTPAEKLLPNTHGLSHYPYLPWSFLPSVPFYMVSQSTIGFFDQRFVYLIAFALILALAPKLADRPADKLMLVMLVGLNPILGNDIVYGLNDILAVFWLVLAVYLMRVDRLVLAGCAVGFALVTKGTTWPILPFYLLYIFRHDLRMLYKARLSSLLKLAPAAVTAFVVLLPFALWDFGAMVEDAWSYNMGNVAVDQLPIKGWGITTLVLAAGWVNDAMEYFPFWMFEALFALPVLAALLFLQWRRNTLGNMLLGYGLFLIPFLYFSRTMNANYLGYALAFIALGYFAEDASADRQPSPASVVE